MSESIRDHWLRAVDCFACPELSFSLLEVWQRQPIQSHFNNSLASSFIQIRNFSDKPSSISVHTCYQTHYKLYNCSSDKASFITMAYTYSTEAVSNLTDPVPNLTPQDHRNLIGALANIKAGDIQVRIISILYPSMVLIVVVIRLHVYYSISCPSDDH